VAGRLIPLTDADATQRFKHAISDIMIHMRNDLSALHRDPDVSLQEIRSNGRKRSERFTEREVDERDEPARDADPSDSTSCDTRAQAERRKQEQIDAGYYKRVESAAASAQDQSHAAVTTVAPTELHHYARAQKRAPSARRIAGTAAFAFVALFTTALAFEMAAPPGSAQRAQLVSAIRQSQVAAAASSSVLGAIGNFFGNLFNSATPAMTAQGGAEHPPQLPSRPIATSTTIVHQSDAQLPFPARAHASVVHAAVDPRHSIYRALGDDHDPRRWNGFFHSLRLDDDDHGHDREHHQLVGFVPRIRFALEGHDRRTSRRGISRRRLRRSLIHLRQSVGANQHDDAGPNDNTRHSRQRLFNHRQR
jgi:hypothetical protein